MFLPTRNATDRNLLIKYVDAHLRVGAHVQVLLGNRRWVARAAAGVRCERCDGAIERALAAPAEAATYCLSCALGGD